MENPFCFFGNPFPLLFNSNVLMLSCYCNYTGFYFKKFIFNVSTLNDLHNCLNENPNIKYESLNIRVIPTLSLGPLYSNVTEITLLRLFFYL